MTARKKSRRVKTVEQKAAAVDHNKKYEDAQNELGMVRRWVWMHPDDAPEVRNYAAKKARKRAALDLLK